MLATNGNVGRRWAALSAALIVLLFAAGMQPRMAAQQAPTSAPVAGHAWIGPDGKPLPFKSDDEALDFLRTAEVVAEKDLGTGITHPHELTLEKNGVQAHAVFKYVDEEKPSITFEGGQKEMFFRDSYLFEPAAYEVSQMLGLGRVPPTVLRRVHGRDGSLQMWVEKAMTEEGRMKRKLEPTDLVEWNKQRFIMNVFDALIYNTDRTQSNILITPDWRLWFIDHTRAFRRFTDLPQGLKIRRCDRALYQRLKELQAEVLQQHLKPYLHKDEISAILKRRDQIVKQLDKLIAEKGESAVLFTSEP